MKTKKGQSMCFFSAKGGVGKTTNLLNLAGILEQLEKRVLIIDMDLYSGGVALFLNVLSDKSVYNVVFDMMNNTYTSLEDYVTKIDNYIDILSSPKDPRDANKIDCKYLQNIIDSAKLKYDAVLIDTNHALNEINLTILDLVDKITFITTNDPLDLKNIKSILSIFDSLDKKNYKILLNNSRDPFKDYFSMYEIKKIIEHNIDYTLSVDLYLKDMDKLIMKGKIVSLDRKFADIMTEDYKAFLSLATDMLENEVESGEEVA